jgi:calmodulin
MKVSPDKLQEMDMTFKTYAQGGSLPKKNFNKVVRAVGLNPTEATIADLKKKAGGGDCDFETFKKVIVPELEKADDKIDEIVDSFSVFDADGSGQIAVNEFKHVLTTMGESLSPEELAEVMTEVEATEGMIDYKDFATMIFAAEED